MSDDKSSSSMDVKDLLELNKSIEDEKGELSNTVPKVNKQKKDGQKTVIDFIGRRISIDQGLIDFNERQSLHSLGSEELDEAIKS